jgi:hypothetical protein
LRNSERGEKRTPSANATGFLLPAQFWNAARGAADARFFGKVPAWQLREDRYFRAPLIRKNTI